MATRMKQLGGMTVVALLAGGCLLITPAKADVAAKQMLRPGMSVVVSVNTKPNAIKQDAARDVGLTSTANAAEAVPSLQSDAQ